MPLEVTFPDGSVQQFADGTPPEAIKSTWSSRASPSPAGTDLPAGGTLPMGTRPPDPVGPTQMSQDQATAVLRQGAGIPTPPAGTPSLATDSSGFQPWPTDPVGYLSRGALEVGKGVVPGMAQAVTGLGEFIGAGADWIRRRAGMEPGPMGPWSRSAQQWVEEQFPAHPEADLTRSIGQGLGQVGETLLEALATSGGSLARKALPLGERLLAEKAAAKSAGRYAVARMTPLEFADAYDQSLARGDDPDTAVAKALPYSLIAAALEDRLGVGRMARAASPSLAAKLGKSTVGAFVKEGLASASSNALEEAAQQAAEDLIVEGRIDPAKAVSAGVVGGAVGGLVHLPIGIRDALQGGVSPRLRAAVAAELEKATDPAQIEALKELQGRLADLPTAKPNRLSFEEIASREGFTPDTIEFRPESKLAPVHRGPALDLVSTTPVGPEADSNTTVQPVSAAYKLAGSDGITVNVEPDKVSVRGLTPEQVPDVAGALVQQSLLPKSGDFTYDAGPLTEPLKQAVAEVQQRPRFVVDAETVGDKVNVYLPAIQNRAHLKQVLREEAAHRKIATPEGQQALAEFMRVHPLPPEQLQALVEGGYAQRPGETEGEHKARLTDEYLAKLDSGNPTWKRWVGEAGAWIKKALGFTLTPPQAGRLMLRSLRNATSTVPGTASARESLSRSPAQPSEADAQKLVEQAQAQFPTAPKFVIGSETAFRGDHIELDPRLATRPEWERQNEIRTAVLEAGVTLLPPTALSEDLYYRLHRADAARLNRIDPGDTPIGRQKAATVVLLQHIHDARLGTKVGGWVPGFLKPDLGLLDSGTPSAVARMASLMGLSLVGHKGSKGLLAAQQVLQGILDSARESEAKPLSRADPLQVEADLARPILDAYRPWVEYLQGQAGELENRSYERSLFKKLSEEMEALAGDGKARVIDDPIRGLRAGADGETETVNLDPASPSFPDDMEHVGRPLSAAETVKHETYVTEIQARAALRLQDSIAALESTIENLPKLDPRVDLSDALSELDELQKRLDKVSPEALQRAAEIRASNNQVPHAEAARRALSDPFVAEHADTVGRLGSYQLRPEEDLSPGERSALEVSKASQANQAWIFRERIAKSYEAFLNKEYLPGVRRIRERLRNRLGKEAELQIAMQEVAAAAAGEAGQAGTLSGRQAAEFLRDNDTAIRMFAEALAGARPDTKLGEFRSVLLAGGLGADPGLWSLRVKGTVAPLVQEAAREAGISQEATGRILSLLRTSPEFRNAIVELHETASEAVTKSLISAIESIEASLKERDQAEAEAELASEPEDRKQARRDARDAAREARETAAAVIARLNNSRSAVLRDVRDLQSQLAELEVQRETWDLKKEIADSALRELPNTRRMVYEFADGVKLDAFGTQPEVTIRAGGSSPFTDAKLREILGWIEAARDQLDTVDPQTRRGLLVALGDDRTPGLANALADSLFTPEQIGKTLAPSYPVDFLARKGFIRTKEVLAKLVPGFWGRRIEQTERNWIDVHRIIDMLTGKEGVRRHGLMLKAYRSLDLNPADIGDQGRFRALYNETCNELRQHESGVEAGQKIWTSGLEGKVLTEEIITLVRNDRRVGREGQRKEQVRPYGGIRENLPGRQVVRAPGETGDVGLARLADSDLVRTLAERYEQARTQGGVTNRDLVDQFWALPEARDALRSHVRSADRTDMLTTRTPEMRAAELKLKKAIEGGRVSLRELRTVDDWAGAIGQFLPPGSLTDARVELRKELDQYGALAISRAPTPGGGPAQSTASVTGEGDRTEFTSGAVKMAFPPSWYNYGAVDGLRGMLSRVADPAQVEYLETLRQAGKELADTAQRIKDALSAAPDEKARALALLGPLIKWHTTSFVSGDTITDERAAQAAERMKIRSGILQQEYERVLKPDLTGVGKVHKFLGNLMPFLLLRPTAWASNVFGGPIALQPIFSRFFGTGAGTAMSLGSMGISAGSMVYNIARDTAASLGVPLRSGADAFLEQEGIGASYDRNLVGEQEALATGTLPRSRVQRAVDVAKSGADKLSEYVGVRRGDKDLNRLLVRTTAPAIFWRLKQIASAWRALGSGVLDERVTKLAPGIREWLGKFGNPEEVLAQFQEDVSPTRFFESKLGRRMTYALVEEANASTVANRPNRNALLALMGWTAHQLQLMASETRSTPDTARSVKIRKATNTALLGALAMSVAYYVQVAGRKATNETISKLADSLGLMLSGVPRDLDDDPTWGERLRNWVAEINGLLRAHVWGLAGAEDLARKPIEALGRVSTPSAQVGPTDPVFWDRPWQEIAQDLALSVPAGVGLNQVQLPALGILSQGLSSTLQAARGIQTIAVDPTNPAARAGGMEDIETAARNSLNLLGLLGSVISEVTLPGGNAGRVSRSRIAQAAAAAGIKVEPPFQPGGLGGLNPTPVRKGLLAAGRALADAQETGDQVAIDKAQAQVENLSQYVVDRAERRALDRGDSPEEARRAGQDALKRLLPDLNPYRHAVGRSLSDEELAKLKARVGADPEVTKDEKAAQAVTRAASRKFKFPVTRGMTRPTKPRVKARILTLR